MLEDDELFQLIKNDVAQQYPKTLETGRWLTPVEANLRMLTVQRLQEFDCRDTEWQVGDSLMLRWFCRVCFNRLVQVTQKGSQAVHRLAEILETFILMTLRTKN